MHFLANENFPGTAVAALSAAGHDVAWVRRERPGLADAGVLAWAIHEQRILITFDKDFGELAWNQRILPATCGIILFRIAMPPPDQAGAILSGRITARTDWAGHFSVIEATRVRMRALDAMR